MFSLTARLVGQGKQNINFQTTTVRRKPDASPARIFRQRNQGISQYLKGNTNNRLTLAASIFCSISIGLCLAYLGLHPFPGILKKCPD
jgi:hypothetical protein